ncbi:MAG TPA: hypothetical protein VMF06_03355 [Candidatus Limnocylindria bacterium]|nr:hypothetical protein [Candidatus Limnocylindria bacterium]
MIRISLVAAALGTLLAFPATAQVVAITNPSFEADVIDSGTFRVDAGFPQGWAAYDPSSILNGGANSIGIIYPAGSEFFPGGAPDGNNAAIVYLAGSTDVEAGLQQTLSTLLLANTRYTVSVGIGNIASGTSTGTSSGGPGVFYDLSGFPGYRIDLLAGGVVLASDNSTLSGTIPEGEFRTSSFVFDTTAVTPQIGQNLGIRLVNLAHSPGTEVDFDNVSIVATPVPEPATCGIAMSAILALAFTVKRKASISEWQGA